MLYTSVGICVREMTSVRQTRESQTRRMRQGELAQLTDWVGRTEARCDRISAPPVAALAATLDRDEPEPADGDVIPPVWQPGRGVDSTLGGGSGGNGGGER